MGKGKDDLSHGLGCKSMNSAHKSDLVTCSGDVTRDRSVSWFVRFWMDRVTYNFKNLSHHAICQYNK